MRSVLTTGQPMELAPDRKLPAALRQVLAETMPVERVRRMLAQLWGYQDDKLRVVVDGTPGVRCDKITVELKTDPPRLVYHGCRVEGQRLKGLLTGPQWHDVEFHPGRWCDHLFQVFEAKLMAEWHAQRQEAQADEKEQQARYGPVDDAAFFG